MSGPQITVDGLGKLVRFLKSVEPELADELKQTNAELADTIGGQAQRGAPKVSGKLAGTVRSSGTARTGIIRAGRAGVPYTGPIHFGWKARNIAPDKFLYRAFDANEDRIVTTYLETIERLLAKVPTA